MAWFSRPPDRRTSTRFQAEVPVIISVVGDEEIASVRVLAKSIGEGGLSTVAIEGLEAGQPVSLEIHLPNATHPIWVEATVRHNSERCGLQFSSLGQQQKQLIKRYCRLQPPEKRRSA